MMATGLADWLRAANLRVVEVAGWQERGHGELGPASDIVVVDHHTAGSAYGVAPSLSTCLYGVEGVPGPLCNALQTREADGNDTFMVLAAGISYNAGTGGWGGVSGNRNTLGLEIEHTGLDTLPPGRMELAQRFNAAVLVGLGQTYARTCQHFEWSDTGKPDVGYPKVDANWWRQRTLEFMQGGAPSPPPQPTAPVEGDMHVVVFRGVFGGHIARLVDGNGYRVDQWASTGNGDEVFGIPNAAREQAPTGVPFHVIKDGLTDQAARWVAWSDKQTAKADAS